jgi:replicative DNA helicase
MVNTFESKIIKGIASGVIAPSEVSLSASHFTNNEVGMLFTAAQMLENEALPIDLEGLFDKARKTFPDDFWISTSDFSKDTGYLSKSVVHQAISNVRNNASRELLTEQLQKLIGGIEEKKTNQIIGQLKNLIDEVESGLLVEDNGFVFLADLTDKVLKVYQDLNEGKSYAVPTFFKGIDEGLVDGFSKGDLHLIAGMSGVGKSALMLNFAMNQAKQGYCVGVVSLEMSDIENVIRLQAADTKIPRYHFRKNMHSADLQDLTQNLNDLSKLKIAFNTVTGDIYGLPQQVREMVDKYGLDILYVDYSQLYSASQHSKTKAGEIDKVSKTFKQIAMENNIPVVALTQFAKSALNAGLFDLSEHFKESSSLKQDCSTAMVVQVEQVEGIQTLKTAKVLILKNRNGACFVPTELEYEGRIFTFREVVSEAPQNYYDKN